MSALQRFRDPLTARQLELLAHAANGLTYEQIADREFIQRSSVKDMLDTARARAGARNITELVALAVHAGFLVYHDEKTGIPDPS